MERAAFRAALVEVVQGIASLPPASADAPRPSPPDDAHGVLQRLVDHLEAADAEALQVWKTQRAVFQARLPEQHAAIEAAIERFDFAGALALLRPALQAPSS